MSIIEAIKEELSWTGTSFEVSMMKDGRIAVAGFWYEKDWGEICGVESTYDMVEEAIDDLEEELNLTIDDSMEADEIARNFLEVGEDMDTFIGESQGWICVLVR